jgi:hypothetical protein
VGPDELVHERDAVLLRELRLELAGVGLTEPSRIVTGAITRLAEPPSAAAPRVVPLLTAMQRVKAVFVEKAFGAAPARTEERPRATHGKGPAGGVAVPGGEKEDSFAELLANFRAAVDTTGPARNDHGGAHRMKARLSEAAAALSAHAHASERAPARTRLATGAAAAAAAADASDDEAFAEFGGGREGARLARAPRQDGH